MLSFMRMTPAALPSPMPTRVARRRAPVLRHSPAGPLEGGAGGSDGGGAARPCDHHLAGSSRALQ